MSDRLSCSTESLQRALRHAARGSREAMLVHRLHALLLLRYTGSARVAAAVIGDCPRTIQRWARRCRELGLAGLADRPHVGRTSRLSPGQLDQLRGLLGESADARSKEPSAAQLHDLVEMRLGTHLSHRQCRRILARLRTVATSPATAGL